MKGPNWKTPLILSLVLVALGGFAYWLQYSYLPKQEKVETGAKKPLQLPESAEPKKVTLRGKSGIFEFKQDEQQNWLITQPEAYVADPEAIKNLIRDFSSAIATETIELSSDAPEKRAQLISDYGLSPEKRNSDETRFVQFELDEKTIHTIWFGVEHPLGDKAFVGAAKNDEFNSNTIYLLANHYLKDFDHDLNHFRSKKLFDFEPSQITSFQAKLTLGNVSAKQEGGLWTVNSGSANHQNLTSILNTIADSRATSFPESKVIRGQKPLLTYQLQTSGDNAETIELKLYQTTTQSKDKTRNDKHYYVQSSQRDYLAEIEPTLLNSLDKPITHFRNTIILSQTEKVTATRFKLEGTHYDGPIRFEFDQSKWVQKEAPFKGEAPKLDPALVSKLIDTLAVTKVQAFMRSTPTSGTKLTISIGDEQNPEKFKYMFAEQKNRLLSKDLNDSSSEILLMEEELRDALPFKPETWKAKP